MSAAQNTGGNVIAEAYRKLMTGILRRLLPSKGLRGIVKRASSSAAHEEVIDAVSRALGRSPKTLRLLRASAPAEKAEEFYSKLFEAAVRAPSDRRKVGKFIKLIGGDPGLMALGGAMAVSTRTDDELIDFGRLVRRASCTEDLFSTRAAATWLDDPRFLAAYDTGAGVSVWGHKIRWRVHTLLKCAMQASRIKGDFIECGVDRGGTALSVLTYLTPKAFAGREFHLFDTYEGVQPEQMTAKEKHDSRLKEGRYVDAFAQVGRTFAPFPFVKLVRGMVPGTLSQYRGKKVAYLHIDMNVSLPECEALKYFWPKLSPGAPVIFDDYGFPFHQEQRKDLDRVAASFGAEIMMLPTGQGLMWK